MMAVFLWVLVTVVARRRGYPTAASTFTWPRFWRLLRESILATLAPIFVISGVVFGFVTIIEVAALSIVYVLFLGIFVYRSLDLAKLVSVFRRSAIASSALMAVFAVVGIYQYIVATEQLGGQLSSAITALGLGRTGFLIFTTFFFLAMGAVLDAIPVMLIFFPVLLPIAIQLGIDPTHFGVVTVLNLMIGLLTPPIGVLLFVQTKIAGIDFGELLGELWPHIVALLVVLMIITFFPQLVLWIPNLVL